MTMFSASARERFCERYFAAVGATCQLKKANYREYVLPIDVDKELTDRPYYWLWVERTGEPVKPTILRLAFTEEAAATESERLRQEAMASDEWQQLDDVQRMFFRPPTAEYVAFGSFRLAKIFQSTKARGSVVAASDGKSGASPWLLCQFLVTYHCDLSKQRVASIGVNLKTGQVMNGFLQKLQSLNLQTASPSDCLRSARVTIDAGIDAAKQELGLQLAAESHTWAADAARRLQSELESVNLYYDSIITDVAEEERALVEAERQRKLREHEERIRPYIDCELTQLGVIRCKLV